MGISYTGRASVNPAAPEAFGICARCGFPYKLRDLVYQQKWAGTQLITTRLRVCGMCWDDPTEQLRAIRLPPDPMSVPDPRPEDFSALEKNFLTLQKIIGRNAMFPVDSVMAVELTVSPAQHVPSMFEGVGDVTGVLLHGHQISPAISGAADVSGVTTQDLTSSPAISGAADVTGVLHHGHQISPAISGAADVTGDYTVVNPSIAVFDSATSTGETIDVPADVEAGDLIVLLDKAYEAFGSAPSTVIPSGFTSISNLTSGDPLFIRQILSYKLAVGTEGGTTLTGMTESFGATSKALYVFRRTAAASSLNLSTPNEQITSGNPTSQNVAASGGSVPLVVIGAYGTRTETLDPRTMSPAKDGEINPDVTLYLAYKIYNSSPANVSVDMDDEGSVNILQSLYVEMS